MVAAVTIFGVDTSGATVDWAKVKAAGIAFAIVKATEGNGFVQSTLAANLKGMRAAGLVPGVYHFLISGKYVSGAAQCDYFLSKVGDVSDLIVALDVEVEPHLAIQPDFPEVRDFVDRFHQKYPNHPVLIYSGAWYWASSGFGNPDGHLLGPLWDSKYVSIPQHVPPATIYRSVPASYWSPGYGGWPTSTLLQFTAWPSVDGVAGACDASAFLGTVDQLRRLLIDPSIPDTATEDPNMAAPTWYGQIKPHPAVHVKVAAGQWLFKNPAVDSGDRYAQGPFEFDCTSQVDGVEVYGSTQYLVYATNAGGFACVPSTQGGLTVTPLGDCTAAIKAATDPLNKQITDLTSEVTTLKKRVFTKDAYIGNYPKG